MGGMFFCHPDHPWTKKERFLMFLISLAVTLVPSAMLAAGLHHGGLLQYGEKLLVIVFVTIPDTIFGVILYQLSVVHTKCPLCAPLFKAIKGCLFGVTLTVGIAMTSLSSLILNGVGAEWGALLRPLLLGKLYSYATWFPIFLLVPCIGFALVWRAERRVLEQTGDEEGLVNNCQPSPEMAP